jgi:hypothetical protein
LRSRADSTTTVNVLGNQHYFNHAQKLFEIGDGGTLGALTWGLGGLVISSHRTMFAQLSDELKISPPSSVEDVANKWSAMFWKAYSEPSGHPLSDLITEARALNAKAPFDLSSAPNPLMRTGAEENRLSELNNGLFVGFCIGGYILPSSTQNH